MMKKKLAEEVNKEELSVTKQEELLLDVRIEKKFQNK
jgi:hypothetical protein